MTQVNVSSMKLWFSHKNVAIISTSSSAHLGSSKLISVAPSQDRNSQEYECDYPDMKMVLSPNGGQRVSGQTEECWETMSLSNGLGWTPKGTSLLAVGVGSACARARLKSCLLCRIIYQLYFLQNITMAIVMVLRGWPAHTGYIWNQH